MKWLVAASLFSVFASAAALVAFLPMFRNPLIYYLLNALGRPVRRPDVPPEASG